MCKAISVKIAVLKSAVDGTKKCGRGTQKKSYPNTGMCLKKEQRWFLRNWSLRKEQNRKKMREGLKEIGISE
jgi:hypothetical protein